MNELFIVTGASRGMGAAMAAQLAAAGHRVLGLSRRVSEGVAFEQWAIDLADAAAAAQRLEAWLAGLHGADFRSATLINNAAMVARAAPLQQVDGAEVVQALRVGLEAPMLLTAAFLRATGAWPGLRRVLNISSGLGRRAMGGQATYCALKAGLDHYSRCVAIDEARAPNGAKICSLAPGIIATDMQVQLRSADEAAFPDAKIFRGYHEAGQLATPEAAAARVLAYLARPDFGTNPVADVRDT
jgi:NAD(P)-dependent dehydrogenase (short-subunit alcohol dehydrogenase family)